MKEIVITLIGAIASIAGAWIAAGEKANIVIKESIGVIRCEQAQDLGKEAVTDKLFSFKAEDCRGQLPDSSYVGFLGHTYICGGTDNVRVMQPPNPGVHVWGLKPSCGNHPSEVSAIYIKVPK